MADVGLSPTKILHQCSWCHGGFYPKRTDRRQYCSRGCAYAAKSAVKLSDEELASRLKARAEAAKVQHDPRSCDRCGSTFVPKGKHQRYCSSACLAAPAPAAIIKCMVCGTSYAKRKYDRGHCSVECRAKWRKASKHASARITGAKAAARKARKLRQRGVTVESVNPLNVLQRDGWRCQLCGQLTPKHLRGTYDDRAPEVDHIVPLSKGGEHSYRNTQCACRKCNLAKSGDIKGQMRLFG